MLAKAVATEAGANFINISMSMIASKWFGEVEKYVKAIFILGNKTSPSVRLRLLKGRCISSSGALAVTSSPEAEGARGHLGSGKLHNDTLSTLRILIAKVGTADALAFFLPGVTSGLAKVLRVSNFMIRNSFQMTSGVARNTGAIEQAIKGLTEILVLTCVDQKNAELYTEDSLGPLSNKHKSIESALEALRCLSVQIHA
eukprot:Gb_40933 [translate_table: standard]